MDREEEVKPTVPVRVTIEIADEDWNDPAFKEMWEELVEDEVFRVVKVESVNGEKIGK